MQTEELREFETILAEERTRLVRFCAWFSGNHEAAEDLAQETLISAWKSKDQLTSLDKLKPWTTSIARNVCLNWSRQHFREQSRIAYSIDSDTAPFEEGLQDETNLEVELDRHELARLLDQALSLLPTETARMLIEHYIKETSHAEIAEMMKLHPGTVAVRLQRGKLTLQKLFRKNLRAETAAFGLMDEKGSGWEETNIWCPWCGEARLVGKFQKEELFALRCPQCDPTTEGIMAGLDLTKPYHAKLFGNIKTYKPAYARLLTAFRPLYQEALKSHTAPCLACGGPVEVNLERDQYLDKRSHPFSQIILRCPACGWMSNKSLTGLVIGSLEAQRFWREYPRIRTLPALEIDIQGSPALLTRIQSVTDNAELTVISRRDTFEQIEVHSNIRL